MKILVTGATGFIGGYLVKRLEQEGHEILCTIREKSNTELLRGLGGVSFVRCDINDAYQFSKITRENKPEFVFHCAASVMEKNEDKLNYVNAGGTFNVCSACLDNHVGRMIYVSSVAVVSGNDKVCLDDGMPYKATNAYGRSKILAEKTVKKFRAEGLNTAIIRPGMVYGVGEPHLLYKIFGFISRRLLPLPGIPGMESKLQLAAVENVVHSLIMAMERKEAVEGTFLVADKEIFTVKQCLSMLYRYLDAGTPPVLSRRLSGVLFSLPGLRSIRSKFKDRTYDISRAEKLLGYDPAVSTREGLKLTAEEWKRNRVRWGRGHSSDTVKLCQK